MESRSSDFSDDYSTLRLTFTGIVTFKLRSKLTFFYPQVCPEECPEVCPIWVVLEPHQEPVPEVLDPQLRRSTKCIADCAGYRNIRITSVAKPVDFINLEIYF